VWDTDYDGDENIVEVYVRYLRRKIDLAGHNIETVRGVATGSSAASGSSTTKHAPPLGESSTLTMLSWASTICVTIDKPRPAPPATRSRGVPSRTRPNTRWRSAWYYRPVVRDNHPDTPADNRAFESNAVICIGANFFDANLVGVERPTLDEPLDHADDPTVTGRTNVRTRWSTRSVQL
jgi:hypothetical protein